MFPETSTLLEHEGYLMQGCFKSSLSDLRAAASAEPSPFYAAFFNYAIGLERLLKILLLLDKWHRERKFLSDDELRAKGHNVEKLYNAVCALFPQYAVAWQITFELDTINRDILSFLADFANGSRYYNLNALAGAAPQHAENPIHCWQRLLYRVYEQDVPGAEPIVTSPMAAEDSMSNSELSRHHCVIAASSGPMCWRLVQLLIPLQELLIAVCDQVHKDDFAKGGPDADRSVPYMHEFLDFVCDDMDVILKSDDWPY